MEVENIPEDASKIRANRVKFLLVVALFVLPVALAAYLHFTGWRPGSTMNHGTLVQPARPEPGLMFSGPGLSQSGKELFGEKWNLVVVTTSGCDAACQQNLYTIRQIHIGQGKNQQRIRRILVQTGEIRNLAEIGRQYPDLAIVTVGASMSQALQDWLAVDGGAQAPDGSRVYMIDPLGNYMMYYVPGFDPSGMRKDLARLLRVSHIG